MPTRWRERPRMRRNRSSAASLSPPNASGACGPRVCALAADPVRSYSFRFNEHRPQVFVRSQQPPPAGDRRAFARRHRGPARSRRGVRRRSTARSRRRPASLRGRTLINMFFEASTRTQASLRAGRQAARRRRHEHVGVVVVDPQGRDPDRHRGDAERHASRPDRDAPSRLGRGGASVAEGRLLGDQRRRRPARASDPGAARRADHPAAQGRDREPDRRDLRRHPAFARGALQHHPAANARRPRPRGGAVDLAAGRHRAVRRRSHIATCARDLPAATS